MKPSSLLLAVLLLIVAGPSRADEPPTFLQKWGTLGSGPGQFDLPEGMAVDASGNVFVADARNNRVQKFTNDGTYVAEVGGFSTTGQGGFDGPKGVAVDPSGNVYVGDYGNSLIQAFDNNLAFLRQWPASAGGGMGLDPSGQYLYTTYLGDLTTFHIPDGSFVSRYHFAADNTPYSIGVGKSGAIYVGLATSLGGPEYFVAKLSPQGSLLAQWGGEGSGDGQFFGVQAICVDADENVYAFDGGQRRVQKFTSSGAFLTKWGSDGSGDGQFSAAIEAMSSDDHNNIFVLDAAQNRVQKFASPPTPIVPRSWGRLKVLYR